MVEDKKTTKKSAKKAKAVDSEETSEAKEKTAKKTAKKTATKKVAKKTTKKAKAIGSEETSKPKVAKVDEKLDETADGKKKKTSDRSELLRAKLKERAEKLAKEKLVGVDTEDIKEELEKKKEMLVPLNDYTKTGIHLGTKVITPDMREFVYRRRADSIAVLNTGMIDDQIKKAIDLMVKYEPSEIVLACKREAGWEAAKLLGEVLGIKVLTKKYPGGMMTNTELEYFYEPELVIVCDPWVDRNALGDAVKTNKKVLMLADTNNFTKNSDIVIPCNNKASKSLGLIFYLLSKGYADKKKIKADLPSMNVFVGDDGQEI